MTEITGYRRNNDGTLELITVLVDRGGPLDAYGYPLTPTGERTELLGWPDEGPADVYINGGGIEIIVPRGVRL